LGSCISNKIAELILEWARKKREMGRKTGKMFSNN
jgi:hypothetical protein